MLIIAWLTGLVAGAFHVFSGPDHLAAIAPLAASARTGSWRIGLRWGAGHAGGVALVGLAALYFRELLPLDRISGISERLVGVFLIGLGLWGLRLAFKQRLHGHPHHHGDKTHWHVHVHPAAGHHIHQETPHHHTHTALAVGTLHGVAGSSHFLGVLPAMAFTSTLHAVNYLVAYGLGTVLAMAGFASVIRWTFRGIERRGTVSYRRWMAGCAFGSLLTGCYWLFS